MKQTQEEPKKKKDTSKALRSEMEAVKAKEVRESRKVTLQFKSCCGCGCDWVKLEREVPWDSPMKNGDKIEAADVLETDIIL